MCRYAVVLYAHVVSFTRAVTDARRTCVQSSCWLGHSKLESTVRYLGIEVDDALEISEQTEI